jgi:hypothetical protein
MLVPAEEKEEVVEEKNEEEVVEEEDALCARERPLHHVTAQWR